MVGYENGGPGVVLSDDGANFTSFRALLMMHDDAHDYGQARAALRALRALAPRPTEAPLFFHLTDTSADGVRHAVDQMAQVGFELLIFSFGSDFDMETSNQTYVSEKAALISYANARGVEVAGYDLVVLDRGDPAAGAYGAYVGDAWVARGADGVTKTGDACAASGWDGALRAKVQQWLDVGLTGVELDGPYGGGACGATNHSGHRDLADSVYRQVAKQNAFMTWLVSRGVFINTPDNYHYYGSSKTGMGYSEDQYSLPRWEDLSVSRAGLFDDLYERTPTMGWMFVPLVQYHGGGDAAAFEPLSAHANAFEWAFAQYLSFGTMACFRGFELFDSNATRAVVAKWSAFYRAHRGILTADVVHLKRPDMQGLDAILHADARDPEGELGMLVVFNPTDAAVETELRVPLYYTGLDAKARVEDDAGAASVLALDRGFAVTLPLSCAPRTIRWFLVTDPDA